MRPDISGVERWVVKIGSALLTADGAGLDHEAIGLWAAQIAKLSDAGVQMVLVSSGAIAEGIHRLQWPERPRVVYKQQAAAAVGQAGLAHAWEQAFERWNRRSAQVLLTHDDVSGRQRYINARHTLNTLLEVGVIPVINENDTVATDDLKLGDNDNLAALVANLIDAELVTILTDQSGLFSEDPRKNPEAVLIPYAQAMDPALDAIAGDSKGRLGSGGMATKLSAARRAARSGAATIIVGGHEENVLMRLYANEALGTYLAPLETPLQAKKNWLANQLQVKGKVYIDAGAVRRLQAGQSSLLPVGVIKIEGNFRRGELVQICNQDGEQIGRGLVNYAALDASKIAGLPSKQIYDCLGFSEGDELIHKDEMVVGI